jgi:hypothetical protein
MSTRIQLLEAHFTPIIVEEEPEQIYQAICKAPAEPIRLTKDTSKRPIYVNPNVIAYWE